MFAVGLCAVACVILLRGSGRAATAGSAGSGTTILGSAVPKVRASADRRGAELGVRFSASRPGFIVGVRFYKGQGNTGRHVGSLWAADGTKLASARFAKESTRGWQSVRFAHAVPIQANTPYIASYHAPRGHYAEASWGSKRRKTHAPLAATAGRYATAASPRFPEHTRSSANYFVDVIYAPSSAQEIASPALPPLGQPSCVADATEVTTAEAVRATLQAGANVCVTAAVGDVNLDDLSSSSVRFV